MAQELQPGVAVAVIKTLSRLLIPLVTFFPITEAAVLPEDRADVLYHSYDGGGITIDGPSVLIRKGFDDKVSLSANYYVDNISSASIDAVTQASPYTENRTQTSISADYLTDNSTVSYSYTQSTENDFDALTQSFSISQEMLGGLTTVSLGYTVGDNTVTKTGDTSFEDFSTFKNFRVSVGQVITKNLILSVAYDNISDEGFLNNPYRRVRLTDPADSLSYIFQDENYPRTRTSNAASFNLRYYLPYRASIHGGYRYFTDSWDIKADTFDIGYTHPLNENWTLETSLRLYSQGQASFYSDLFASPSVSTQTFQARDKELSTYSDITFGLGVIYSFNSTSLGIFERTTANLFIDYIQFDYDNFRDIRVTGVQPGTEPLYSFSATVLRVYFSFWF